MSLRFKHLWVSILQKGAIFSPRILAFSQGHRTNEKRHLKEEEPTSYIKNKT